MEAAVTVVIIRDGNSKPLSKTINVPADEHRYVSPRIDEPGGYSFDVFVEDGPSG